MELFDEICKQLREWIFLFNIEERTAEHFRSLYGRRIDWVNQKWLDFYPDIHFNDVTLEYFQVLADVDSSLETTLVSLHAYVLYRKEKLGAFRVLYNLSGEMVTDALEDM